MQEYLFALSRPGNDSTDYEPEEDALSREEGELTLIDPEMFYDLLLEQQEQM